MTITIKDDTSSLIELLWVREAWGLQPSGDIPPRLTRTPTRLTGKLADERWEEAWTPLWAACVDHAGHSIEGTLARLQAAPPVSAERDQLLRRLVGPTWRERFGERAFDESFETWQQQWFDDIVRSHTVPLDESPERRVVKDLAAAWEAGLTTVVTIPCTGDYTRIISDTAMLVTDDTRRDPLRYAIALRAFRHGEPS
jgi:hypothetical protein